MIHIRYLPVFNASGIANAHTHRQPFRKFGKLLLVWEFLEFLEGDFRRSRRSVLIRRRQRPVPNFGNRLCWLRSLSRPPHGKQMGRLTFKATPGSSRWASEQSQQPRCSTKRRVHREQGGSRCDHGHLISSVQPITSA